MACFYKLTIGNPYLHMLKLRFINRERTEDCNPLMVSVQVSDESLTFLGVYVLQQAVLRDLVLISMA